MATGINAQVVLTTAACLAFTPAQARNYASIGPWLIEDMNGFCVGSTQQGKEAVMFSQTDNKMWLLGLGPFRTLREGQTYRTETVVTDYHGSVRRYTISLEVQKSGLAVGPITTDFANALASDPGKPIRLDYRMPGTRAAGTVWMINTAEIIRTIYHCREQTVRDTPTPEQQQPSQPQKVTAPTISGQAWVEQCAAANDFCYGVALGAALGMGNDICVPSAVTTSQLNDVAVRYIREHPESRHLPAVPLFALAWIEAWPCPTTNKGKAELFH